MLAVPLPWLAPDPLRWTSVQDDDAALFLGPSVAGVNRVRALVRELDARRLVRLLTGLGLAVAPGRERIEAVRALVDSGVPGGVIAARAEGLRRTAPRGAKAERT